MLTENKLVSCVKNFAKSSSHQLRSATKYSW